jgi:hypothetical protein
MTSDKVAGVSVENGDLILLNENGGKGNRINGSYTCAAVCGGDMVAVRESGEVQHFNIEGPRAVPSGKNFGKSYDATSIQLNDGLNFMVQRSNGQTDVYTGGQKSRTIGEVTTSAPSSNSADDYESPVASPSQSYDVPDGFMAGMAYRCDRLIKDPIPGPWAKICVWLTALSSLVAAVLIYMSMSTLADPTKMYAAFGIIAANFGLCYWLRNVLAKVLVRSWYGAPLVTLGAFVMPSYPEAGSAMLIGGLIAWLWPVWPIAIIAVTVVGLVLVAIGKTTPTMGNNR